MGETCALDKTLYTFSHASYLLPLTHTHPRCSPRLDNPLSSITYIYRQPASKRLQTFLLQSETTSGSRPTASPPRTIPRQHHQNDQNPSLLHLTRHANPESPSSPTVDTLTISPGGPNLFEDYTHPAYAKLQTIGREITRQVQPKAIIVLSAHWQASPSAIEVNTAASQPLIYDYYGFPPHYYKVEYPNTGSPALASRILTTLHEAGIEAEGVNRGLDHGVFAPFLVAFDPEKNPLKSDVPIVQVSLFDSDDGECHLALGKALAPLREEGVLVICSGMAVHNLRDLRGSFGKPGAQAYTLSFDAALKEAVEQDGIEAREKAMVALLRRSDARRAHPSFEHLLPMHVAAGAAGEDKGRQLWTLPEGSMSWAQYRFGEVEAVGGGQL